MTREIRTHIVEGDEKASIRIYCVDQPGHGGANHAYAFVGPRMLDNPIIEHSSRALGELIERAGKPQPINLLVFQNGPIQEVGLNGHTHESLLAILIDRLEGFQRGAYACEANALALHHLGEALSWLQKRTRERIARGVEGTSQA